MSKIAKDSGRAFKENRVPQCLAPFTPTATLKSDSAIADDITSIRQTLRLIDQDFRADDDESQRDNEIAHGWFSPLLQKQSTSKCALRKGRKPKKLSAKQLRFDMERNIEYEIPCRDELNLENLNTNYPNAKVSITSPGVVENETDIKMTVAREREMLEQQLRDEQAAHLQDISGALREESTLRQSAVESEIKEGDRKVYNVVQRIHELASLVFPDHGKEYGREISSADETPFDDEILSTLKDYKSKCIVESKVNPFQDSYTSATASTLESVDSINSNSDLSENDQIRLEKLHAYCTYILSEFNLDGGEATLGSAKFQALNDTGDEVSTYDAEDELEKLNNMVFRCIEKQEAIREYLQLRLSS